MPPKRRPRGGSNSNSLFQYNNQVELTFKSQPKENNLPKVAEVGDSGSDDDDNYPILKKRGKKNAAESSSSESSSASDSETEQVKISDNEENDVYEIPDDDHNNAGPKPITPPPKILPGNAISGLGRQAARLSRTMGEKMRYLQYLQKEDTPSPVASWSDVVVVNDNYGTPTSANRKITVRIRTRNGVERFHLTRNETFQEIFNELAKKHSVNADSLSLSFTDTQKNFQTLKPMDTPSSVNLSVADIIDCVVVQSTAQDESFENSENIVNIKVQGSDSKSVKQFKVLKNEPLGKMMQQYADFRQNEKFLEIFNELAKKHSVNVESLSLSFTDTQGNFQTLKGVDTPSSVNLSIADIIDCVVVQSTAQDESFENSENIVSIKVQGSESGSVKQFKVLKNEPLGKMMQQYSDFRQVPLSKLKFSFDGETMTSEQSPDDLDMDDENVVDVQIK